MTRPLTLLSTASASAPYRSTFAARTLRRAAPAGRHRPRDPDEARSHRARRTGIGARRFRRAQILNLLLDLQDETGVAYLFISHDLAVVRAFADRMIVMDEGRIVETGTTEGVLAAPQAEATRVLIDAVPQLRY